MQSDSNGQNSAPACKPKKKSRTLRLHKWTGYASSAVAGVMSIGDIFGYFKADWACVSLLVAVVGISIYGYWLRLHTSEPVK